MQREIKFRGIHINTVGNGKPIKEWYYGCLLIDESRQDENRYRIQPKESGQLFAAPIIPETVGQYTGLKDKNGKEVYEGDVVRDCVTGKIKTVLYHKNSFILKDEKGYFYWTYCEDDLAVIGNIYDDSQYA